MIVVNDLESYIEYEDYVVQFERELYLPSFPNENEREPFNLIIERIKQRVIPYTDIILEIEDDKVIAGCISDYYPSCKSIEPIYLVVREEYRKQGYAGKLLNEAFKLYDNISDMYVEVDNPKFVSSNDSAINPDTRIKIYEKLGFKMLDFNYVQPPLDEGLDYEYNLRLMHKSKDNKITKERLIDFLENFYEGLNCKDSPVLQDIIKEIQNKKEVQA